MMKKILNAIFYAMVIAICGTAIGLIAFHALFTPQSETFEVAAIVENYNENDNCSTLVDWNGEAWFYEGELEVGKMVIVVFDDMGTTDIYDDEIIEIRG